MPRRMPRTRAKSTADCCLCPQKIRAGQPIALDFNTELWVHTGCLVKQINAGKREAVLT